MKRYDCHVGEYFERPEGEFVRYQDAQSEVFFLERWRRESEKSHERKDARIHKLNNELTAVSLSRDNAIRDAQSHYGKYRDTLKELNKLKGKS